MSLSAQDRIFLYAERYFRAHGHTTFPTVRQVARAVRMSCHTVILEVESANDMELTYWNVDHTVKDADRFVETTG